MDIYQSINGKQSGQKFADFTLTKDNDGPNNATRVCVRINDIPVIVFHANGRVCVHDIILGWDVNIDAAVYDLPWGSTLAPPNK